MLASVQNIKDYLGITDDNQNQFLEDLLISANSVSKNYTGRDFEQQNYIHYFNWKWESEFLLKQYPVSALISFQYNAWSLSIPVWTDFDANNYKLEPENGKIWLTFSLPKWIQNIKTVYTAWYSNESSQYLELKQAIIQLAAFYYNTSKSDWISSESIDWASLTYEKNINWIPNNILFILNRYKNVQVF